MEAVAGLREHYLARNSGNNSNSLTQTQQWQRPFPPRGALTQVVQMCRNDAEHIGNARQRGHWVRDSEQTEQMTQHREGNKRPGRTSRVAELQGQPRQTCPRFTGHTRKKLFAVTEETERTAFWFPFRSFHEDGHGRAPKLRPTDDLVWVLAAPPLLPCVAFNRGY